MGCLILSLILTGGVFLLALSRTAEHYTKVTFSGLLWALLCAGAFLSACLGYIRLDKLHKKEISYNAFDVIGLLAAGCVGIGALGVGWVDMGGVALFFGLAAGFLVYGVTICFGYLWQKRGKRLPTPKKHKPFSAHEVRAEAGTFGFDRSKFFRDESARPFSRKPPEWYGPAAPYGTLQIEYFQAPKGYSSEEALRMLRVSGAGDNPAHTNAAEALANCCLSALGREDGFTFIHMAATDKNLPKQVRQLYIHAELIVSRS